MAVSFNGKDSVTFPDPPLPDRNINKCFFLPIFIKPFKKECNVFFLSSFNMGGQAVHTERGTDRGGGRSLGLEEVVVREEMRVEQEDGSKRLAEEI